MPNEIKPLMPVKKKTPFSKNTIDEENPFPLVGSDIPQHLTNKTIVVIFYRYSVDLIPTLESLKKQKIDDMGILFIGTNLQSKSISGIKNYLNGFKDISVVVGEKTESELFINAISCCKNPKSILYLINAGDSLIYDTALLEVNELHKKYDVVWTQHKVNGKVESIGNSGQSLIKNPRSEKFVFNHLRSFKNYLCQRISVDYLKNYKKEFFKYSSDIAVMFCVLEMAGAKRCCFYKKPTYLKNPFPKELQQKRNEEELEIRSLPKEQILPHIAMYGKSISKEEFTKFCQFINRLHKVQAVIYTDKLEVSQEVFQKTLPLGVKVESITKDTVKTINTFDMILAINKGFENRFKIPVISDGTIVIPSDNIYYANNFQWYHNLVYHLIRPFNIDEALLDRSISVNEEIIQVDDFIEPKEPEEKVEEKIAVIVDARESIKGLSLTLESLYAQFDAPDMVYVLSETEDIVAKVDENKDRYAFGLEAIPSLFALNNVIKEITQEKTLIVKSGVVLNQSAIDNHKKFTDDKTFYFERSVQIPRIEGLEFVILSGFDNIAFRLQFNEVKSEEKELNNNISVPSKMLLEMDLDSVFESANKSINTDNIIYEVKES